MEEYISITELLNRIRKQRKIVLEIENKYLDPEQYKMVKSLFSLHNPSRNTTINGADINKVEDDIVKQFQSIVMNIETLRRLLIIKEQVNSTFTLTIPDVLLGDIEEKTLSIAQILVLKSPLVKDYYLKFAERLKSDVNTLHDGIEYYNSTTLSDEKINTYVLAKLGSLKINIDPKTISSMYLAEYDTISKEYIEANKIEVIDPLDLENKAAKYVENIYNFYDTIDLKLLEFNSSTKLWINAHYGTWREDNKD